MLDALRFSGHVVVVTGAGSGIGRACAIVFAELGAELILVGRRPEPLEETQRILNASGGTSTVILADVAEEHSVNALRDVVSADHRAVKALVNNAGYNIRGGIEHLTITEWKEVIGVNLSSLFLMTKAFLPLLRAATNPAVVNVASLFGMIGFPGRPAYSAAKGGVIALTQQLAIDLGPLGIRVNAVSPGTTLTERFASPDAAGSRNLEAMAQQAPLRRNGTPSEIANVVAFVASDAAAFLHGENVVVDGGRRIV